MSKRHPALDLVNSRHIRGPGHIDDELGDAPWLDKFLARWALPQPLPAREHAKLRELRTLLRTAVDELTEGAALSAATLQQLHTYMPPAATRTRLEPDGAQGFRLVHSTDTPRSASNDIAQSFAALVADDGWHRIKACCNEHCRWAFYDESRNRSRRWCDSTACGNVMKVRAFRKRKEGEETA